MKHVLIQDESLNGREYGALRCLEAEIIKQTNAQVIKLPEIKLPVKGLKMGHNMKLSGLRKIARKQLLPIDADVLWCILMGPENYKLDLFSGWDIKPTHRILYLFDTLNHQLQLIKKLFSGNLFNIKITSFNDAVAFLKKATGCNWHFVTQGVSTSLFHFVPLSNKIISFSSYGRKDEKVHDALKFFCEENDLYYDFTTEKNTQPVVNAMDLYKQYAWHLNHSVFNISWPVEVTNPERASLLNPITCRWFEAAASNAIILGQQPNNKHFSEFFPDDFVITIDREKSETELKKQFLGLWEHRVVLHEKREAEYENSIKKWSWESRVKEILSIIK